eukprot:scaffold31302_cov101-Isochrysis_galbana.AAC.3
MRARGLACWRRVARVTRAATPATRGVPPPAPRHSSPHSTLGCRHALLHAAHPEEGTQEAAALPLARVAPFAVPAESPRPRALGHCALTQLQSRAWLRRLRGPTMARSGATELATVTRPQRGRGAGRSCATSRDWGSQHGRSWASGERWPAGLRARGRWLGTPLSGTPLPAGTANKMVRILGGVGLGFGDGDGRKDEDFVDNRERWEGKHTLTCFRLPCASSEAASAVMVSSLADGTFATACGSASSAMAPATTTAIP